jgi:hypothetical protein
MEEKNKVRKEIIDLLNTKSILKQDVYANSKKWFDVFKKELKKCVKVMKADITDDRVRLKIEDKGQSEVHLYIGSDVLVFHMHSNIFKFDDSNYVYQSSYLKNDPKNAYCGVINIYNFLADSFEQNRSNDYGYLIARTFINKDDHFYVEGKGRLSFLYRDFLNQIIDKKVILALIENAIAHAVNFDLLTPPYDKVNVVSVQEMQTLSTQSKMKTGKRLGFKFESNHDVN